MPGIYQSDCYCDDCIVDIKKNIRSQAIARVKQEFQDWKIVVVNSVRVALNIYQPSEFLGSDNFWESVAIDLGYLPDFEGSESTWDSDDYPKYMSEDEESDSPQHCGMHDNCKNAITLPSGNRIGALLSASLTQDGVKYVEDRIREVNSFRVNEVTNFWRDEFTAAGYDFSI